MNVALIHRAEDAAALEAALGIGETIAVTVGDADRAPLLLAAKSRGATRIVRIWDEGLLGLDYFAFAHVLARAVRALVGDKDGLDGALVFAGDRARSAIGSARSVRGHLS